MLRFTLRVIGFLLAAAAFASLIIDGTRSIANNALVLTPLGETVAMIGPDLYKNLHIWLEKPGHPALVGESLRAMLVLPTWLVIGVLGLLFMLVSRRPRPKIGYVTR